MRELSWNDENEAHIARHGITPPEVRDVVLDPSHIETSGRDGTRLLFGTTETGRYLLVVLSEATDGRDYIVTARDLTATERRQFQQRRRRR